MGDNANETPWDPSGFWDAVNESMKLAAELRYLDLAVDYLENDATYPSPNEVYGPTDTINIRLGWTYPFNFSIRQPASLATQGWADGVEAHLQGLVGTAATWAQGEFSSLRSRVDDVTQPIAATFVTAAQRLKDDVANALSTTVPEELSTSLDLGIEQFWGTTAEAFQTGYVDRFGAARENQIFVAKACGVISAAAGGIVKQAQHSLMNAVCTTRDALRSQLLRRPSQHSGVAELSTILMIASNVAELLGVFKLPESVERALEVSSTMIEFAQQGVELGKTEEFTAATAEQIVSGMSEKVTTLLERYDAHWDSLQSERVARLTGIIESMPTDKPFFPPRPDLADGATPGEFYYHNSPMHDG